MTFLQFFHRKNFFSDVPLFLTPLINAGKIDEARRASRVQLAGPAVESAGYLTVNQVNCGSNLFFWYFPAKVYVTTFAPCTFLKGLKTAPVVFGFADNEWKYYIQ